MEKVVKKTVLIIQAFLFSSLLHSQDLSEVFQTEKATWFGLDYSEACFIGSESFPNPDEIKDRFFLSWNNLVQSEPDKYNIGTCFYKRNIKISLDNVTKRNQNVEIKNRIHNDGGEAFHLNKNDVFAIIDDYEFKEDENGLGIVFIVESYDKLSKWGNYYVVLFNIESKGVLINEKIQGGPRGFGVRNYWAGSFYKVLQKVKEKYYSHWKAEWKKSLKKKRKSK